MFPKTPRCPACQSGMQAPGIRHSAACKRKRLEFDRMQEAEVMAGESPPAEVAMEEIPAAPAPPTFPTSIAASDVRGQKRCEFLLVETNIYLRTQRAQQNLREALFLNFAV